MTNSQLASNKLRLTSGMYIFHGGGEYLAHVMNRCVPHFNGVATHFFDKSTGFKKQ